MPGPAPKPSALRQRRNRSSTQATLPSEKESAQNKVPELPQRADGAWHPRVVEWWGVVWRSPMASEYLEADVRGGLHLLAELYQDLWTAESRAARLAASAEIRHHEQRFGLSPIDRRRLQWEVEKGEQAAERTTSRRTRKLTVPAKDPRDVLKVV